MNKDDSILVTGAAGLVGKNLESYFRDLGYTNLLLPRTSDCDLTDRDAVRAYFDKHRPAYVYHMAGRVRGIMGNMQAQGAAYLDNALMNIYVIDACREYGVKKIVAMGTVAMYPDPLPSNPLREDTIWQGAPHHSEYGYAQAKRGMLAQLEAYHENYGMPYAVALSTNLYGPHDRFNIETGHVIPSLVKKFYDAKKNGTKVPVWGNGEAKRDFLYVKDAARALHMIMDDYQGLINLATGVSNMIRDAVDVLTDVTGMQGQVEYDTSKPGGQIFRAYDVTKLTDLGFKPDYDIDRGLRETYAWFDANNATARIL